MITQPLLSFREVEALVRTGRRRTIAVAAAQDADVLRAVRAAADDGLTDALLVGPPDAITTAAQEAGLSLAGFRVVPAEDAAAAARTAVALVREGAADVLMKGLLPTPTLLKAVLDRGAGLRVGAVLSHVAVTEVPGWPKLLFVTDGGINIDPPPAQRLEIVRNAVDVAQRFGVVLPRVALLALVESVDPRLPETVAAAEVAAAAETAIPGAIVEGPVAPDVALSVRAARKKGLVSRIAGETDVFVGASISAANHIVKFLLAFAGARVGGVVVGAKAPIVLLSRSDTTRTKMDSILAALAL
jgi:phosphate butyryltransferase